MLPAFLIVGAQRAGTTSLFKALIQHRHVLRPPLHKGVHYFDTDHHRGMAWYRGHFPLLRTARRIEAATGTAPVTGESSPYYMFHPLAAERIARDLPGVKVIVALRDPVERAYSAFTHERARGFEPEADFARALALEEERLAGQAERLAADPAARSMAHQHNGYRARGRYIEQLERLERIFTRERMFVVQSEDFFSEPEPIFADLERFLGIPAASDIAFERHNARPRSPMPESLRAELTEHFEPYDERLATWLGGTPSWRK
ncbi:MAG: sulfotransferase [Streptosporangiales bacterium]|nr:sulfotransferase [Streptosporangiales bacterium]